MRTKKEKLEDRLSNILNAILMSIIFLFGGVTAIICIIALVYSIFNMLG